MKPKQNIDTTFGQAVNVDAVVMWRDASFFRNPGCAVRYHLPRAGVSGPFGHLVALCSRRIQLDETNATTAGEAGPLLCKRCGMIAT